MFTNTLFFLLLFIGWRLGEDRDVERPRPNGRGDDLADRRVVVVGELLRELARARTKEASLPKAANTTLVNIAAAKAPLT